MIDKKSTVPEIYPRSSAVFDSPAVHLLLICVFAFIAYSNTFYLPFQFDDTINIVTNSSLRDLNNFWPPTGSRWFGFLTLALNYSVGGLDTTGYHIANTAIHILNAMFVYWLILLTLETPFMKASSSGIAVSGRTKSSIALISALVFVTHPVETQAVTYIIQRFVSLATFFYLLTIILYVRGRLYLQAASRNKWQIRRGSLVLYFLSFASALLAMKSKEISFTLPLIILLYEFSFFHASPKSPDATPLIRKMGFLLPFAALLLVAPLSFIEINKAGDNSIFSLNPGALGTNIISQKDYLLTQFRVIATYLRLLLLPVNQSIDYDYQIYTSFFDMDIVLPLLFYIIFLSLGIYLFYRSIYSWRPLRLVSFGIFWFFITLSVESSFIPLTDVIFEHRVYLPSIGIIISGTTAAWFIADIWSGYSGRLKAVAVLSAIFVILTLTAATFLRNEVWQNELTLWQDAVKKNPGNARAHSMIGNYYKSKGDIEQAMFAYYTAIRAKPEFAEAHVNLGNCYLAKGMLDEGLQEFMIALNLRSLDAIDQAILYTSIGNYYMKKNLPEKAVEYYRLSSEPQSE